MAATLDQMMLVTSEVPYNSAQFPGITALVLAGFLSLVSVFGVFLVLITKAMRARLGGYQLFAQTHIAPYFISLLIANATQSIGSILNINWLNTRGPVFNHSCIAQGITKNVGNVGAAVWSLTLSVHAFDVLFLRNKQRKWTPYIVLITLWIMIFMVDMIGPIAIQKREDGPFFGISGYWCWITPSYRLSQVFLEYLWMFLSAILCGLTYFLIYIRLRGNLGGTGWRMKFRRIPKSERWAVKISRDEVDSRMYKLSRELMLYPLAYVLVIVPIAFGRFLDYMVDVPFWYIITADFVFNLHGLFNVIIFLVTMKYAGTNSPVKLSAARKSIFATNFGITPFVIPKTETASGVNATKRERTTTFDVDLEKGVQEPRRQSAESFQSHESIVPLTKGSKALLD